MIASTLAVAATTRFAARYIMAALALFLNLPAATRAVRRTAPCFVAVTAIVSTPAPYRVVRVVTTGVRRYEDDGSGTVDYCEPLGIARLRAARAAVDHQVDSSRQARQNVEHVVIRSTSPEVAAQHLAYVAAAGRAHSGFDGVAVVALKAPDGSRYREYPLPRLISADSARAACDSANAALLQSAASFHWAC